MKKTIAQYISYIFHPVVFSVIMPYLFAYHHSQNVGYSLKWELFSGIFIGLALLIMVICRIFGFISDFDISKRSERTLYYAIMITLAVIYLLAALFFKGIFFPLSVVTIGIILGLWLFEIVNNYTKISNHIGIVTAFVITMGILYGMKSLLLIVWIIPLVAWARIILKKHTIQEVAMGVLFGGIITYGTFLLGEYAFGL